MSEKKIDKILVGVDDSADALLAFDYAIKRAKEEEAELIIASVLESDELSVYQAMDKDYIHGKRGDLEKHILDYREKAIDAGVASVRTIIGEGDAGETIVKDIIPKVNPDLLIIGSESKRGLRRHFGSQAAYMAKYSPTSVLVIR
ncbi:universal stress protein UspA-like nucleotide-binding protein [Liquorilactobacillus sucicola DSM 21376 = JCM 15457]|uniref:Universal stress protein UspA-like nucleotide-binding protein n=1 Tax=Liquorilactobacillus sucicola DSM 21376 = JCM 15457 TaxID=1423806 RepID=A0A0R2DT03_9LACO|nr:universal stress protein [Liquorilactobacillus sucicola]KRN06646.1 universal stress protein UspA-like nucleotide-binding protein [Liquorilactobacillus sucicola DSM 21376 = JCM 15457]